MRIPTDSHFSEGLKPPTSYETTFSVDIPLQRPKKLALHMVGTSNQSFPEMAAVVSHIPLYIVTNSTHMFKKMHLIDCT